MQTFVGKGMSLLFNTPSKFVIAFLPRSKRLLISWLQSPSTVILQPKKMKSVTVFIVTPSVCPDVMGLGGAICVSEVTDVSPCNLASIFHDVLYI